MVKKIYLLIGIIVLLTGCSRKLQDLIMKKTPYTGNELRIDGYYYSSPRYDQYTNETSINVAVFYKDGFCIYTNGRPPNLDTLGYIENDILLNTAFIAKLKNAPGNIGVFQIMNPNIVIEAWGDRTATGSYYGEIINDTTFIINKAVNNGTGKSRSENLTYRFVQFSPKPDSTNNYVR
jgi:hypothetical protein